MMGCTAGKTRNLVKRSTITSTVSEKKQKTNVSGPTCLTLRLSTDICEQTSLKPLNVWYWSSASLIFCYVQHALHSLLYMTGQSNILLLDATTNSQITGLLSIYKLLGTSASITGDQISNSCKSLLRNQCGFRSIVLFGDGATMTHDTTPIIQRFFDILEMIRVKPKIVCLLEDHVESFLSIPQYKASLDAYIYYNQRKLSKEISTEMEAFSPIQLDYVGWIEVLPAATTTVDTLITRRCFSKHKFNCFSITLNTRELFSLNSFISQLVLKTWNIHTIIILCATRPYFEKAKEYAYHTDPEATPEFTIIPVYNVLSEENKVPFDSLSLNCLINLSYQASNIMKKTALMNRGNVLLVDEFCGNLSTLAIAWFFLEAQNSVEQTISHLTMKIMRPLQIPKDFRKIMFEYASRLNRIDNLTPVIQENLCKAMIQYGSVLHNETNPMTTLKNPETTKNNGIKQLEVLFNDLRSLLKPDGFTASSKILVAISSNIINNPSMEKYRTLRLDNPKIYENIARHTVCLELLQHCTHIDTFITNKRF